MQKSLLYAMFLPGSVEKLFFTGFGTGGWVVECQKLLVFKEATTALAFTSFCLFLRFFVDDSNQAMFSNGYVLP